MTPWKRARARERNAGYREGYAAGLRAAARYADARDPLERAVKVAHELHDLAHVAQLSADANAR